jgi:nucleotide-binding universal stress UspA family protein
MSAIRSILVPFDFSRPAARALQWASDLRRQLGSAEVHVLHLWNLIPAAMIGAPEAAGPSEEDVKVLERDLRAACLEHGLEASVSVQPAADLGEAILRKAQEIHTDLIVMGTHGRSGLTRAVLGSVADRVVRRAPCPVTVLRAAVA